MHLEKLIPKKTSEREKSFPMEMYFPESLFIYIHTRQVPEYEIILKKHDNT